MIWLTTLFVVIAIVAFVLTVLIVRDMKKYNRPPVRQTPEERQAMQMAMAELAEIEWQEGIGPEPAHLKYERQRKAKAALVTAIRDNRLYVPPPDAVYVSYDEHGVPT